MSVKLSTHLFYPLLNYTRLLWLSRLGESSRVSSQEIEVSSFQGGDPPIPPFPVWKFFVRLLLDQQNLAPNVNVVPQVHFLEEGGDLAQVGSRHNTAASVPLAPNSPISIWKKVIKPKRCQDQAQHVEVTMEAKGEAHHPLEDEEEEEAEAEAKAANSSSKAGEVRAVEKTTHPWNPMLQPKLSQKPRITEGNRTTTVGMARISMIAISQIVLGKMATKARMIIIWHRSGKASYNSLSRSWSHTIGDPKQIGKKKTILTSWESCPKTGHGWKTSKRKLSY